MGERKVLINYIPPDFDPSIIPKFKRDKNKLVEVRTMLPFSIKCLTCGEYMYRGKKFNAKKENVAGETYLGIRKLRFYIKCSFCSADIVFKTDPKNSDYEMESGASRNFEVWRESEQEQNDMDTARAEEEKVDAMKALENRTLDSKLEMDVLDALDEIKAINQRHERVNTDALLSIHAARNKLNDPNRPLTKEEEDEIIKNVKFKKNKTDDEFFEEDAPRKEWDANSLLPQIQRQLASKGSAASGLSVNITRKRKAESVSLDSAPPSEVSSGGLAGLMEYGSSDGD